MSTVFYIQNKKYQKEYLDYKKFVEKQITILKQRFIDYANRVNGGHVNEENIDSILREIEKLQNTAICHMEPEEIRFGQLGVNGFLFFNDFTCEGIRDLDTLKNYLDTHPDCIIVDEYNDIYTWINFIKTIK